MKRTAVFIIVSLILAVCSLSAQNSVSVPGSEQSSGMANEKKKIVSLKLKDGTEYTGEAKRKRPHGTGKALYANGDTYEGEFVNGKREGKGVYRFKDGEWYEGEFKADRQHGKGVFHFANFLK